jgi:deazaflavin-dependent oxidoreductase (nitroreductase family)
MPLPISLARPTCDRRDVASRILREAQRGGGVVVQAHPKQAPGPTLERACAAPGRGEAATDDAPSLHVHRRRPSCSVRSNATPRGRHSRLWKRFVARAGRGLQLLWRYRLGWLAGHSLLVLTHAGRRTGRQHRTVLYVQRYDRQTHEATVVSVWGESQWLRNIRARPAVGVEIGLQRYVPEQRFLSTDEIFAIEKRFRGRHRIVAWGQAKLMGWPWPATDEQLLALSAQLRGVAFRPA